MASSAHKFSHVCTYVSNWAAKASGCDLALHHNQIYHFLWNYIFSNRRGLRSSTQTVLHLLLFPIESFLLIPMFSYLKFLYFGSCCFYIKIYLFWFGNHSLGEIHPTSSVAICLQKFQFYPTQNIENNFKLDKIT